MIPLMDEIQLKGGAVTLDQRLDRVQEFDEQSRDYPIGAIAPYEIKSKLWRLPRSYYGDQGQEGACVEFGISHELGAQPVVIPRAWLRIIRSEHRIYWPAQGQQVPWVPEGWRGDPWPGGSYPGATPFYEGTSVLTGIKVARLMGFFDSYRWAFSIEEALRGVSSEGPAVTGMNWTRGWSRPDPQGLVHDDGDVIGGHCTALIGVLFGRRFKIGQRLGLLPVYTKLDVGVIAQSWGLDHGDRGRIYVLLDDLEARLKDDGEVCFPIGRRKPASI